MYDILADKYPHIAAMAGKGPAYARVEGTGLAVWEVAWLDEVYEGDLDAIADSLW